MRKFWMYSVPLVVLAGFIVFMNSGDFLKKPLTTEDDFPYYLRQVEQAVEREDWAVAQTYCENLKVAWEKVSPRIQFSVDKDEMKSINLSMARLEASIAAQDRTYAMGAAAEIREHWEHLNE